MYCVYGLVYCVHIHVHSVHVSKEGCRAPSPGGHACMTHRTRAASALLVPAGCSKLMQSELGVCKRGKGQFRGVSHTGHWDPRPGVQSDTQYMLDFFSTEVLDNKNF